MPYSLSGLWPCSHPQSSKFHSSLPPAPRMAGRSWGRLGATGSERARGGGIRDWAETSLFCLPHKPARASAAPSGAFRLWNCSQNDRLVAPSWGGGGGGVQAGSPRQGGAGGLKIAAAGFQLANVEAGSWRRGGRQAVFAHSARLFPLGPRSESRCGLRGGAGTSTLVRGARRRRLRLWGQEDVPLPSVPSGLS